ncbi:glutamate synthase large subunit [Scopulibacillus cellulosilyticus]|uniref:Glutamate synthase large subunit n=1 Tax=Scopulibacillus cellulosilyticus TaxID=2665665 RepID=A0ABW2PZ35_9BACL
MNIKTTGLYRPEYEHDACGIGFYADVKDRASHEIVSKALEMLCRLDHRAGRSADGETGDGAGILVQIPHVFFKEDCSFSLPDKGDYAVGMLFLPQDKEKQEQVRKALKKEVINHQLSILGWRTVPVSSENIGEQARDIQPFIQQVFIKKGGDESTLDFEKRLYIIRKRLERTFSTDLYIASFSSQTIVYKGMLNPEQIAAFYIDLGNPEFTSSFALVHSRFSTNTFPSWERAHPNRLVVHNGEINTIKGNANWFKAREEQLLQTSFKEYIKDLKPVIDEKGSDSAMFDNVLEFLTLSGYSLPEAVMMMVPEPWEKDYSMEENKRSFYEFNSLFMEAWDGPMALGFTNGRQIGAVLDRNGLRPGRYYVTYDDRIIFSSEVGVIDVEESNIKEKCHLMPGQMLFVDLEEGRIVPDAELKEIISSKKPYSERLKKSVIHLGNETASMIQASKEEELIFLQKAYGYHYEELMKTIKPMAEEGKDPTGSMGVDTPLAVLSNRPQLLYYYFKQSFAQVTNPPIDSIREDCVTSTLTWIGSKGSWRGDHDRFIQLKHPFLTTSMFYDVQQLSESPWTLNMTFPIEKGIEETLEELFREAELAIENGSSLIVLSDRNVDEKNAPIPALLAASALHQHLIRIGKRTQVSLIVDSGEPRDVHHMAMLLGYGADAVHPYLAYESIAELVNQGHLDFSVSEAIDQYIEALVSGVVKVMSKIGISTIQSYRGAQTFEAVGIANVVLDQYFTGTHSQIDGITLDEITKEVLIRHQKACLDRLSNDQTLDPGSELQWRKEGEHHQFNPQMIHILQRAARKNDQELYRKFVEMKEQEPFSTIRSMLTITSDREPVPIDEVESAESIFKRFKTGAMSYGSISKEAHEALAVAMNRIGGKSNSGEGGEESERFSRDENGDWRRSAIKQVASGRFGVTSHYLTNAEEIQIKMAQGAKPGEGGQLPSHKVYPWVAEVRGSTPGVGLISPPPHHDIYSIEDLAQLIYDLKRANPSARISVKLAAKAGVGTIAAGVAKGMADVILISGHDGGTGASPKTSLKHAGIPWEIGLAETHQTLMLNGLRDRVVLETDGKLMTGKDVIIAACLGAEEYGFSTAPLVVLGCLMMRACHLDTCPVGIATQNPKLREKFMGSPDHIVNYMRFIAEDIREILAACGYRSLKEMVGETHLLKVKDNVAEHWKAKHLNLSKLLYQHNSSQSAYCTKQQDHQLEKSFDFRTLIPACTPLINQHQRGQFAFDIKNTDRTAGTTLGHLLTKRYGASGMPEDSLFLSLRGSAGQSFGAFLPKGISMKLEGDVNDYIGKGLSGGKLIVRPTENGADDQAIIGNVAFYGATSGEAYIRGKAGQRFCVRNSGVNAVVEGIGDHGCEYMTGGCVVILGEIGKNFAAGMSGGTAYILSDKRIDHHINFDLVDVQKIQDEDESMKIFTMIHQHAQLTGSPKAKQIINNWHQARSSFIKVVPREYQDMQELIAHFKSQGLSEKDAKLEAFNWKKDGKSIDDQIDTARELV